MQLCPSRLTVYIVMRVSIEVEPHRQQPDRIVARVRRMGERSVHAPQRRAVEAEAHVHEDAANRTRWVSPRVSLFPGRAAPRPWRRWRRGWRVAGGGAPPRGLRSERDALPQRRRRRKQACGLCSSTSTTLGF